MEIFDLTQDDCQGEAEEGEEEEADHGDFCSPDVKGSHYRCVW